MVSPSLEASQAVLGQYAGVEPQTFLPLAHHGGFSGASLWRGQGLVGRLALRAFPPGTPASRLEQIHGWMRQAYDAGLPFIPQLHATIRGQTWVEHAGRLWELLSWMPGQADFHANLHPERLVAASTVLAQLHKVWGRGCQRNRACLAVASRLETWKQWTALLATGWRPDFKATPYATLAERAWTLLPQYIEAVPRLLELWRDKPMRVQPCVVDPWHDHWLFEGDRVSGLIDYGNARDDHPAIDLARMLGSLVGEDTALWDLGLDAYSEVRQLSQEERELARVLDVTGVPLAMTNWLRWLYQERKEFADQAAVAKRLEGLVRRLETKSEPGA